MRKSIRAACDIRLTRCISTKGETFSLVAETLMNDQEQSLLEQHGVSRCGL